MEYNNSLSYKIKGIMRFLEYRVRQLFLITNEHKEINTNYGRILGVKRKNAIHGQNDYYAFEGIPYAKPPINELRFREPEPPEPWPGILKCTRTRAKPCQIKLLVGLAEGSEDCLYLNVYTKKLKTISSDSPLPVMFWIYGGAFQSGEASNDFYAPDHLMARDVIVVTFNYRLGILGFLCLDDPKLNVPGNAGLKDQVLALKWVKENIHHFNGDPNNITVFGESAGAVSIHMLMLSAQSKGLFHKAILQSGSVFCPWGSTDQHDLGYKFACHIGYRGLNIDKEVYKFLRQQSASKLTDYGGSLLTKDDRMKQNLLWSLLPVVEPYATKNCIINQPFQELFSNAWSNDIPIMAGAASSEGLFHYSIIKKHPYIMEYLTESGLTHLLPDDVKESHTDLELNKMALKLRMLYFKGQTPNKEKNFLEFLELLGHRNFWFPVYRALEMRKTYASKTATYGYYFDMDFPRLNNIRLLFCSDSDIQGSCHADDLCYIFNNALAGQLSPSSKEFQCIQQMTGMWYNFALSSNPNCKEIKPVKWKEIKSDQSPTKCLLIRDKMRFEQLPIEKELNAWSKFYSDIK